MDAAATSSTSVVRIGQGTASHRISASESVVTAELNDEVVLLNVKTGIYFGLDAVGARIWRLLAEGIDEWEIYSRLLAEYVVEPPQLRSDLSAFLDLLAEKGLTQPAGG